jgi:hypothetical protein
VFLKGQGRAAAVMGVNSSTPLAKIELPVKGVIEIHILRHSLGFWGEHGWV